MRLPFLSVMKFSSKQKELLYHFAEWLQYDGKWLTPEQQVEKFEKDQTKFPKL